MSAWNDNGKANIIDESRPDLLYRSDFFGGLGWMMTRRVAMIQISALLDTQSKKMLWHVHGVMVF